MLDVLTGTSADSLLQGGGGRDYLFGDPAGELKTIANIQRVSLGPQGNEASGFTGYGTLSPDAKKIIFASAAPEYFAPGEANGIEQIFIKDLATGAVTLLTAAANGAPGNAPSTDPVLSPDGRWLAFITRAANLINPLLDPFDHYQLFVKDLKNDVYIAVSYPFYGSPANGPCLQPVFSPHSTYLAFYSEATNLVANDTNGEGDIFLVDTTDFRKIFRASTTINGGEATGGISLYPSFSMDGKFMAFMSEADNLLFPEMDQNGQVFDVFVKEIQELKNGTVTGPVIVASTDADGNQDTSGGESITPSLSPDGREVAFTSNSNSLVSGDTNQGAGNYDVFIKTIRDGGPRSKGTIRIVSRDRDDNGEQGNGTFLFPQFSPDGTRLAFRGTASNLVPGTTLGMKHAYIKDLTDPLDTGPIELVSRASGGGAEGNGETSRALFSFDGRFLIFDSEASNILGNDFNANSDIFIAALPQVPGGNDILDGGTDADFLFGGDGDDLYPLDNLGDTVIEKEGEGFDTITAPFDFTLPPHVEKLVMTESALMGAGNDGDNLILGTAGNNTLLGQAGKDELHGLMGHNRLHGGDGDDVLFGGDGNDKLWGDDGDDVAHGEAGDDIVHGNAGNDRLYGGKGNDRLEGWAGNDRLWGDAGRDVLKGFSGNDILYGGRDRDSLYGDTGNDTLAGGSGNDRLEGGAGNDKLNGGTGNDRLIGESGNDRLEGGAGNDVLIGGLGKDTMRGGPGKDRFVYTNYAESRPQSKDVRDTILSFSIKEGDIIDLSALDASARETGNQRFTYIDEEDFTRAGGELRYVKGLLEADVDGDKIADFAIKVVPVRGEKFAQDGVRL